MSSTSPPPFAGPGRPRVLFLGSAPTLGDGAMGAAILERVRSVWPAAQLHVLTGTPEFYAALPAAAGATFGPKPRLSPEAGWKSVPVTARRLAALALGRGLPRKLTEELRAAGYDRADVVLRQGGPQWNDRWLPRGAVRFHALRLAAAARTGPGGAGGSGRPVAILGQSFGPFEGWEGLHPRTLVRRRLAAWALDHCRVLLARDEASREALDRLGVRRPEVRVSADVALTLEPEEHEGSRRLGEELAGDGRPALGLALRPLRAEYGELHARRDEASAVLAEALDRLAERYRLVFLSTGGADDDRALADVVGRMDHGGAVRRLEPPRHPGRLAALYGCFDALLAVRLHPMILAAAAGTPSVSLAYDPKCRAFAHQVGLDRYARDYGRVDAVEIEDAVRALMDDLPEVRSRLTRQVETLRRETRATLDDALARLWPPSRADPDGKVP